MIFAVASAPGGLAATRFAWQPLRDVKHIWRANHLSLRIGDAKNAECWDAESRTQMHETGVVRDQGGAFP